MVMGCPHVLETVLLDPVLRLALAAEALGDDDVPERHDVGICRVRVGLRL
jgi:hypothetical protein